jgi:CrcB protein
MSAATQNILQVFAGGVLGSALRLAVVVLVFTFLVYDAEQLIFGLAATLAVNILGSAALGVLAGLRLSSDGFVWRFWGIGCLGAFTTFSGFALDAFVALQLGHWSLALVYGVSSAGFSICAAALGFFWASRSR